MSHDDPEPSSGLPGGTAVDLPDAILELYEGHNGGRALNGALWVFPVRDVLDRTYAIGVPGHLVPFAADLFGDLYCVDGKAIVQFETETGECMPFAKDLMEWHRRVLEDPTAQGSALVTEWIARNGALPKGKRLTPMTPFVLGGKGSIKDLKAIDFVEILGLRHHIAQKIKDLPDGARVLIDLIDD